MKLTKLSPKHLFRSKKNRSVSRSDPSSFSSGTSSSSSSSTNLKAGSTTPTTVLFPNSKSPEISTSASVSSDFSADVDLVQAFKIMDKNGDGKITRTELEILLNRVAAAEPLSDEELTLMLSDLDREGEGRISLEKFGEISSVIGPACGSEIRDAFEIFDADRDGKISAEELMGVFIAIGDEECTLDDCRRMIAGVDSDGDGFVCFDDFTRMMEYHRC